MVNLPLPVSPKKGERRRRKAPAVISVARAAPVIRTSRVVDPLLDSPILRAEEVLLPRRPSLHLLSLRATADRLVVARGRSVRHGGRKLVAARLRRIRFLLVLKL
jgi:hypothetical protein